MKMFYHILVYRFCELLREGYYIISCTRDIVELLVVEINLLLNSQVINLYQRTHFLNTKFIWKWSLVSILFRPRRAVYLKSWHLIFVCFENEIVLCYNFLCISLIGHCISCTLDCMFLPVFEMKLFFNLRWYFRIDSKLICTPESVYFSVYEKKVLHHILLYNLYLLF